MKCDTRKTVLWVAMLRVVAPEPGHHVSKPCCFLSTVSKPKKKTTPVKIDLKSWFDTVLKTTRRSYL